MQKSHYPILLRLGTPIMVGQLGTIIMGFADTLMIGRHSTAELAAAGFANNIIGLALIAAMGFSYGLTPVVGALLGAGKQKQSAQKLKNSLLANNLVALAMMALLGLLYFNLHHLGLPADLLPVIRPYYLILVVSLAPQMAFNAFKQFADGLQDTRTPMWIMLAGNALNIVGNWLLIFGHCGLPEMGLAGAGLSTLMSRLFMWGSMAAVFHFTKRYHAHALEFRRARINHCDFRQSFRLGTPLMLQMGMETASFSLSAFYVGWLGVNALAAHQVMITIGQLCFMLYYGMSSAVAVQVSYYRGKGELSHTRGTARAGLQLCWFMALVIALPIFVFRQRVGALFNTDPQVLQMVGALIPVFCLYQIGDALQCIYSNALRGMEDVKPMMRIAFIAYVLVSLPLGYLFAFPLNGGLTGVWWAFPFGLTTAGLLYLRRFQQTTNRASALQ